MTIDGLTAEQIKMLDTMWTLDTEDQLFEWFRSLPEERFNMAMTLYNIIMQECDEKHVQESTAEAVKMLTAIGVDCGHQPRTKF